MRIAGFELLRSADAPSSTMDSYRAVLVFDRRPRSFLELESFDWEQPISTQLKRLATDRVPDFDEQ